MTNLRLQQGEVRLTNTRRYPFNDSQQTVVLEYTLPDLNYNVRTTVIRAGGEVGEIVISGQAVNGFKIAYTGSASHAHIRYYILGEN